ncbi:hypothetical protein WA026_003800 [Henosepilachna vigintioctopunctata]|uniref:glutathione-specific gamma-glutamylcyclotransferase n=1 Tax=Henosepilachna vigintioctopunctata TaxID=420089 RepID=A0AAW1U5L3_9CUCU
MWIFGYGSLIWKVDFPYEKKVIGYVKGYERRFYQHSTDHRGTKENPGRVVTLIASKNLESKVYGIAYKIKETDINDVVNHLDYREKGGYQRVSVLFYPKAMEDHPFSIVIYLASLENPQYAGYADIGDIAKQVIKCSGPSGKNIDYVLNLAQSMRSIAPGEEDKHLFDLEKAVLGLLSNM